MKLKQRLRNKDKTGGCQMRGMSKIVEGGQEVQNFSFKIKESQ